MADPLLALGNTIQGTVADWGSRRREDAAAARAHDEAMTRRAVAMEQAGLAKDRFALEAPGLRNKAFDEMEKEKMLNSPLNLGGIMANIPGIAPVLAKDPDLAVKMGQLVEHLYGGELLSPGDPRGKPSDVFVKDQPVTMRQFMTDKPKLQMLLTAVQGLVDGEVVVRTQAEHGDPQVRPQYQKQVLQWGKDPESHIKFLDGQLGRQLAVQDMLEKSGIPGLAELMGERIGKTEGRLKLYLERLGEEKKIKALDERIAASKQTAKTAEARRGLIGENIELSKMKQETELGKRAAQGDLRTANKQKMLKSAGAEYEKDRKLYQEMKTFESTARLSKEMAEMIKNSGSALQLLGGTAAVDKLTGKRLVGDELKQVQQATYLALNGSMRMKLEDPDLAPLYKFAAPSLKNMLAEVQSKLRSWRPGAGPEDTYMGDQEVDSTPALPPNDSPAWNKLYGTAPDVLRSAHGQPQEAGAQPTGKGKKKPSQKTAPWSQYDR